MEKDRSWMYGEKSSEFVTGVLEFCNAALNHQEKTNEKGFWCPCSDCGNGFKVDSIDVLREHVLRRGFRPQYHVWVFHGKEGIYEGNSGANDKDGPHNVSYEAREMDIDYEIDDDNVDDDDDVDHPEEMMDKIQDDGATSTKIFQSLLAASQEPLYLGCEDFTQLSAVQKLFNFNSQCNLSDSGFTLMLELMGQMLPKGNKLPKSNYYAKKLMCPFGLGYQKIHACPNDCVLFRNEFANFDKCPRCGTSRYKYKGAGDMNGPPSKVLWYLPLVPRLKRLFSIKKDAKNLRWHVDGRKKDDPLLRHPSNSADWQSINRKYDDPFGKEVRNLRLALYTDGMNPFGNFSSQHSTWPVLISIYNLPPWLCMKRKYTLMPLLISGPKQPGNDICVYLEPLVEELIELWDRGVPVFDAYANETFTMKAMLFCTINDFRAYGNLSEYKNKGKKACPICIDDIESTWIPKCKHVFMQHRKFLPKDHPYCNNKKAFNGEVEKGVARRPLIGHEVYEQVKGTPTVFGKPGQQDIGLWKKECVLWKLPYWKDLNVRHCLDVMHIEKNVCDAILGTLFNIPGKTKDDNVVRDYWESKGLRPELWAQKKETKNKRQQPQDRGMEEGMSSTSGLKKRKVQSKGGDGIVGRGTRTTVDDRNYLPPACYTLSKEEKRLFL